MKELLKNIRLNYNHIQKYNLENITKDQLIDIINNPDKQKQKYYYTYLAKIISKFIICDMNNILFLNEIKKINSKFPFQYFENYNIKINLDNPNFLSVLLDNDIIIDSYKDVVNPKCVKLLNEYNGLGKLFYGLNKNNCYDLYKKLYKIEPERNLCCEDLEYMKLGILKLSEFISLSNLLRIDFYKNKSKYFTINTLFEYFPNQILESDEFIDYVFDNDLYEILLSPIGLSYINNYPDDSYKFWYEAVLINNINLNFSDYAKNKLQSKDPIYFKMNSIIYLSNKKRNNEEVESFYDVVSGTHSYFLNLTDEERNRIKEHNKLKEEKLQSKDDFCELILTPDEIINDIKPNDITNQLQALYILEHSEKLIQSYYYDERLHSLLDKAKSYFDYSIINKYLKTKSYKKSARN